MELSPNRVSGSPEAGVSLFPCVPASERIPDPDRCWRVEAALSPGRALTDLVAAAAGPLLVVCRSRARAEQVSRLLGARLKRRIPFYHHGLDGGERAALRREWLYRQGAALVVTPGAARELQRAGLRTLIHDRLPFSAAELRREAAWAGRQTEHILLLSGPERAGAAGGPRWEGRCPFCPLTGAGAGAAGRACGRHVPGCAFGAACLRAAAALPPGWREIVAAVAANNRSLSFRELCALLTGPGGLSAEAKKLYMYTGYGYLCPWFSEDIAEAVRALLADGVLRIPRRGAWRRRVALVHREAVWKIRFRNC